MTVRLAFAQHKARWTVQIGWIHWLVLVTLVGQWAPSAVRAQEARAAEERAIPVAGGAGKIKKKAKDGAIKAGSSGAGVLKRKGGGKLDPAYDPAAASRKADKADAADPAGAGRAADGPKDAAAPAAGSDKALEKLDDVMSIKNNFSEVKCKKLPLHVKVTIDFQEAPLETVTKLMSCWMERNFVVATQKRGGKVTILSPQRVSVYEAYRAFLSSLAVNGLTITKKGAFYHIVDTPDARSSGALIFGPKGNVPDEDTIVTRLIRLKHIDAKDAEPILGKFKSKTGDLFIYAPTNTIIITDIGSNIRTILKLLAEVDLPLGSDRIFIRPVQHMAASELVEKINAVFGEGGGGRGGPAPQTGAQAKVTLSKAIADDRSNQLILIATRSNYLKVDALVRRLDVPIPGEGAIHIHHLENADAEDVSSTLSSLAGGGNKQAKGGKGAKGGAKGGGAATLFEGEVKITAHKASNSLVIEASLKDYLSLQRVIAELDRRRKQVYVEAVVMEISTSKSRKTQIAGSAGTTFDIGGSEVPLLLGLGGLGMSGVSFDQLNSGGLAAGLQGPLLQVNAGNTGNSAVPAGVTLSIPAFGFLIQAIQENSDVNVLSTPHILTLNNEDAEITVGRKVPYRSQSMGGLGGLGALGGLGSQLGGLGGALGGLGGALGGLGGGTVQFLDVDLTLKITPQINESDFIKLKIDQQLDEVEGMDPNLGPTTSKRKVTNTVVVRDQQPIVIGGLITDRETTGVAKVPILGDLPLIGMLFRKSTKLIEKKNLLLIVVPHIIKDPSDLEKMHENKMEQIRQFAEELATKQKEYKGKIDYRKKRGFLETVFQAVDKASNQRKLLEKAYYDNQDVDKVGAPDSHDLEFDPAKSDKSGSKDGSKSGGKKAAPKSGDDPMDDSDEEGVGVEVIELPEDSSPVDRPAGDGAAGGESGKKAGDAGKSSGDGGKSTSDKPSKPVVVKPSPKVPVKGKAK